MVQSVPRMSCRCSYSLHGWRLSWPYIEMIDYKIELFFHWSQSQKSEVHKPLQLPQGSTYSWIIDGILSKKGVWICKGMKDRILVGEPNGFLSDINLRSELLVEFAIWFHMPLRRVTLYHLYFRRAIFYFWSYGIRHYGYDIKKT